MTINCTFTGAQVLRPDGWDSDPLAIANGIVKSSETGRQIDLSGFWIMPGIVDPHGDGFERHMAPRRGALREAENGVIACASELAASGITTAVLAQFFSWEGGIRSPDFAEHVFESVNKAQPQVPIDLRLQLRLETHLMDDFKRAEAAIDQFGIQYVVFNDHLPHDRLAEGRKPPRLTGQALKAGRNPDAHFQFLLDLHARSSDVPTAVEDLSKRLLERGVVIGSHDDRTPEDRNIWTSRGATVSEFPETLDAAMAACEGGAHVVMGAPNIVRGASHAGNIAAVDVVRQGLCHALASDYHYPSPRRAAFRLTELGICELEQAWQLISSGPAKLLQLSDRGELEPGKRADFVILDPDTRRVAATISGGQMAYMSGAVAERFI